MTGDDRRALRSAARAILDSIRSVSSQPYTIVPARADEFRHLELRAYENMRADFLSRGFHHLGDIEILDVSNSPGTVLARTMVSEFLSADGRIVAGYYQVRPRVARVLWNLLRGLANLRWIDAPKFAMDVLTPRHIVDLESELSGGGFVVTSNAKTAGLLGSPPTVDAAFFPFGTGTDILLVEHERRLRLRLANEPDQSVIALTSPEGVRQLHLRLHAQKRAYRASVQWVSRAEIHAMASDARLADDIFVEIQTLLREESAEAADGG